MGNPQAGLRDIEDLYLENTAGIPLRQRVKELAGQLLTAAGLVCIDMANILLSVLVAVVIRLHILPLLSEEFSETLPAGFMEEIWWVIVLWLLCLGHDGLYERRMPFWRETKRVVRASAAALVFTLAIIALAKMGGEFSRTALVISFVLGFFLLPLGRYLGKNLLARIGLWNDPVLIMGAGQTGIMIARSFQEDPYLGYRVIGFLDDDPAKKKKGIIIDGERYRILGGFRDAVRLIKKTGIKDVILAAPGVPGPELVDLSNRLKSYTHSLMVVPDLIGMSVASGHVDYLSDDRIVAYRTHNNLANPFNILVKRTFDMTVGIIIFMLLVPVLAIIALAIKLDSPGPVGFAHRRIGQKGEPFNCYKFRSMVSNAQIVLEDLLSRNPSLREEWNRDFKLKNDPRVTRVGRFLRKTSLDELPQIFNVLKGEMSLVGPRPIVREEISKFDQYINEYYMVLPGMTGLWGVSGRSDNDYEERVQLETWYVRNWSVWLDISLLFRTIGVVLGRKGAY